MPQAVGVLPRQAKRLRNLLTWFAEHSGWDAFQENLTLEFLQHKNTEELRRALLGVSGIGPETADSILLYALNRPSFVVDAYTRRLVSRHGLLPPDVPYEELRAFFMDVLPEDISLFNEYHALIVLTGKDFCKLRQPLCSRCPLGYLKLYDS